MTPRRVSSRAVGSTLLVLGFAVAGLSAGRAGGTPLYAAREGRTCDNCHLDPGTWENPAVKDRLCTLSCQSCHVDPAGGGLRNAAGRFFGSSTLPMIATQPRPTRDWDREFLGLLYRRDRATTYNDDIPRGPATKAEQSGYAAEDRFALGAPAGGGGTHSYTQGRYGTLDADPLFRFGWDLRLGFLPETGVFPMQFDLGAAIQPAEHATALLNVGARGRSRGIEAAFEDPATPSLREGFLLLHEFPYQAYVKAGRFVPGYGLRLDDHTSFIRRGLGLDQSLPESRVTGVEIGAAPNYPFASLSWFKAKAAGRLPDDWNPFDVDAGWGGALNAGFRELGWSVGGSVLARRRALEDGGDRTAWGLYGAFNPWFYKRGLPLTYQIEVDRGEYRRAGGTLAQDGYLYQELAWQAGNGVAFLLGHAWEDPDRAVADDEADRVQLGAQITPLPGVTLDARYRYLFPRLAEGYSAPKGGDVFVQFHFWN